MPRERTGSSYGRGTQRGRVDGFARIAPGGARGDRPGLIGFLDASEIDPESWRTTSWEEMPPDEPEHNPGESGIADDEGCSNRARTSTAAGSGSSRVLRQPLLTFPARRESSTDPRLIP